MKGSSPISFFAAQRELARLYPGWAGKDGRKLKRYVLRREEQSGRPFVIRSKKRQRVMYRVTWDILRRHCPELFPERRNKGRLPEDVLQMIDDRVNKIIADALERYMEPRLKELWVRDETIERLVRTANSGKAT